MYSSVTGYGSVWGKASRKENLSLSLAYSPRLILKLFSAEARWNATTYYLRRRLRANIKQFYRSRIIVTTDPKTSSGKQRSREAMSCQNSANASPSPLRWQPSAAAVIPILPRLVRTLHHRPVPTYRILLCERGLTSNLGEVFVQFRNPKLLRFFIVVSSSAGSDVSSPCFLRPSAAAVARVVPHHSTPLRHPQCHLCCSKAPPRKQHRDRWVSFFYWLGRLELGTSEFEFPRFRMPSLPLNSFKRSGPPIDAYMKEKIIKAYSWVPMNRAW